MRDGISMSSSGGQFGFGAVEQREQAGAREQSGIVVNLERADAGREIDDACRLLAFEPFEQ